MVVLRLCLCRMGGGREREGNGEGKGTDAPFRDKPPPPVVSKGCVGAGSSMNAPIRDNRGAYIERVCWVVFCEISPPPPPLSQMGALIELHTLNAPFRDNTSGGGGGGLVSKGCARPRFLPIPSTHPFDISHVAYILPSKWWHCWIIHILFQIKLAYIDHIMLDYIVIHKFLYYEVVQSFIKLLIISDTNCIYGV